MTTEVFHLINTPPYSVTVKYSKRSDSHAVELWRLIIEEFTPIYSEEGGATIVGGWEKLIRLKKGNKSDDIIKETIVRDAWRLRQGLREDLKESSKWIGEVIKMDSERVFKAEEVERLLKELLDGIYGAYSNDEYALWWIEEFLRKHDFKVAFL